MIFLHVVFAVNETKIGEKVFLFFFSLPLRGAVVSASSEESRDPDSNPVPDS